MKKKRHTRTWIWHGPRWWPRVSCGRS